MRDDRGPVDVRHDALTPLYGCRILSRNSEIRRALGGIRLALEQRGIRREDVDVVEIVLAEVMNNVAEHAFRWSPPGEMSVSVMHNDDGIWCEVADRGSAMAESALPLGRSADPEQPREHTPEGGFGWHLIRELAQNVTYARHSNTNLLHFRIALGHRTHTRTA